MRTMSRSSVLRAAVLAGLGVGLLLGGAAARASVPTVINYQGRLTDNTAQQNPLDATVTISFSVWDAATSGTSLWNETQSVQVVKGLFNVLLGSTTPLPPEVFSGGATRYLELAVSGETLSPRQRIAATPFADTAASADQASALGGLPAAAYQRRIAPPCPIGYSINAVAEDGTTTCILGVTGPAGPPGQPGPGLDTGAISGTLTSCHGRYGGVLVYVPGRSAVAYTAADGTYLLSYLPAGTYNVQISTPSGQASLPGIAVSTGVTTIAGSTNLQNVTADVDNCGACDAACSANHIARACANGSCESGVCAAGFRDCDGNKRNDGCETSVNTDPNNCGGCGVACSPNNVPVPTCGNGTCNGACAYPFADCNNNKQLDGCEVHLTNDPSNCGACGLTCSTQHIARACASSSCQAGVCDVGFGDCNGNKQADGCETDLNSSNANCGLCGHACGGTTPTCIAGICS